MTQGFTTPQVLDTDVTLSANSDYVAPSEKAVKAYIDSRNLGSSSYQTDQTGGTSDTYGVLAGLVNASNKLYTTSLSKYVSGSLQVYLNGQLQTQGSGQDWVETTTASGTFTFASAPPTGSEITASYLYASSTTGNADTLDGYHASAILAAIPTIQAPPDSFGWNYRIVPSVASNNLTVAIKGLDGNNPSAGNPVKFRIGNVERTLTSALSVTLNSGTGWMALDSRFATIEQDFFVYVGYNATDGITLGFSRIPYARVYSDFSTTTTHEKYCAISIINNAAAGDDYINIGRFAATLSATASFNWSVPTFTTKNLINRPTNFTRWLIWTPAYTGFSANPDMTVSFRVTEDKVDFLCNGVTPGTSNATTYRLSAPWTNSSDVYFGNLVPFDAGAFTATGIWNITTNGSTFLLYKSAAAVWTNTGNKLAYFQGFYKIA